MSVKRYDWQPCGDCTYDPDAGMEESADGRYVEFSDYAALQASHEEYERLIVRVASIPNEKYSRHSKWVQGLGIEARQLLAKAQKVREG